MAFNAEARAVAWAVVGTGIISLAYLAALSLSEPETTPGVAAATAVHDAVASPELSPLATPAKDGRDTAAVGSQRLGDALQGHVTESRGRETDAESDAIISAELGGHNGYDAERVDPDMPPVSDSNVHARPRGQYAEQILVAAAPSVAYESESYGFDADMVLPAEDNRQTEPDDELSSQVAQTALFERALMDGLDVGRDEDYVDLEDVDPTSHPPVETGASIRP